MKKNFFFFRKEKLENSVLLFVNGPYQLIVGLACVYTYISENIFIEVIGYDMRWNKGLREIVKSFAKQLQLTYSEFPFEFKKSNHNYEKSFVLRSIWNQLLMKTFVLTHPAKHIFVPKIYNNPERAIVSGAIEKILYVYDDGIGLYINRIITDQKNKYVRKLDLKKRPKIIYVCPSNPSLFISPLNQGFILNTRNYKCKIKEVIYELSCGINFDVRKYDQNKKIIILCPSRIEILRSHSSLSDIIKVINAIFTINSNIFFLIKPHPRDNPKEIEKYFKKLVNINNCRLIDQELWVVPIEILNQKLKSIYIISGISTIAINDDFFVSSKVLISGVLGEHREDLTYDAIQFLEKLDSYTGDNVNTLISIISKDILLTDIIFE
ncbi:MAG: hypothetical protein CVU46_02525 [Chloroflexi bacterium HGW-Chloroflexi-8]|nr:MAG: hypothetical protein CVU46_02525 [Chloroflexi bacterium HGW-Chloroflexi-8]